MSLFDAFAVTGALSLFDVFAMDDDFSVVDALLLDDDFSVVGAFAVAGAFSTVVFGFAEALPFGDVELLVDGVAFDGDDVFPFAAGADAVVESVADFGAVSGFTAGAHALAMTIAISGIRA